MTLDAGGGCVVVVGAAGGIGTALCRRLAARGVSLCMLGRNEAPLRTLQAELGGELQVVDAADFDGISAALARAEERQGPLLGAVNLAGSITLKPAHTTSARDFDEVISQNLRSAFALVRAAAGRMMRSGGGSLVLVSSAAARVGLANHDAIAAAKAGVLGLTLSAAATYASKRVRVNAVAPGLVNTPLSARLVGNEASRKASEALHPLGRLGEPDDVASIIDWLLGAEASWVTGQVFGVDGGLATLRAR
jgi:3-oxoacyl-[acyl-carrier protein] reductase